MFPLPNSLYPEGDPRHDVEVTVAASFTLLMGCVATAECTGPNWDRYVWPTLAEGYRASLDGVQGTGAELASIQIIEVEVIGADAQVRMCFSDYSVPVGTPPATTATRLATLERLVNVENVGWQMVGTIERRSLSPDEGCS